MSQSMCTLTDYEQMSIPLPYDLANGHAYHELSPFFRDVIDDLQGVWTSGRTTPPAELERALQTSFAQLVGSKGFADCKEVMISPTASNSIDIIGAYMAGLRVQTLLLEPTFDNLALLFSRRRAAIAPLPEAKLTSALQMGILDATLDLFPAAGAIFLVNPNNPTGQTINSAEFRYLAETCKRRNLILILDNSFRVFNRNLFDDYTILHETGVSFIGFEDTGKCWPTQDLKVSMMVCSDDHADALQELYRELYLGPSLFAVALFRQLFENTRRAGLSAVVWNTIDARRDQLRQILSGTSLIPQSSNRWSPLPVEWLKITSPGWNDVEVCRALSAYGVGILPGRNFFWNSVRDNPNTGYVRISLLKPSEEFEGGLRVLQQQLHTIAKMEAKL